MVRQLYTWLYQCDHCNYAHTEKNTEYAAPLHRVPYGWGLEKSMFDHKISTETRHWHFCFACVNKHGTDFLKAECEQRLLAEHPSSKLIKA